MKSQTPASAQPEAPERKKMKHDQSGEFDYGIEGRQSQKFGPDKTSGTDDGGVDKPQNDTLAKGIRSKVVPDTAGTPRKER